MDYLSIIKRPIEAELNEFIELFSKALTHEDGMLGSALSHIRQRGGKRMRPILILLMARNYGRISSITQHSAVGLELLHTASLVHDDVVDESAERRGQASVNATYNNKVAVLVGDFILANALLCAAKTGNTELIEVVSYTAQDLADGELLQLDNVDNEEITEEVYFRIIRNKTAALFAACAEAGVLSVSSDKNTRQLMREFGENLGICFQIRDDIFDYHHDPSIGKPTGNDMKEGKLTLPVIHALLATGNEEMFALARKVKTRQVSQEEIDALVDFTKQNGGIEYAVQVMNDYAQKAKNLLASFPSSDVKQALYDYVDYVEGRSI